MENEMKVKELDQVVVRFSGDSGDGMQLAGNIFSTVSATVGNDIILFMKSWGQRLSLGELWPPRLMGEVRLCAVPGPAAGTLHLSAA